MPRSPCKAVTPLDAEALERAALDYVARYATTGARLSRYLARKLRERGWQGPGEPQVEPLVRRFADKGFIDDRSFAVTRSDSMLRRGYGAARVRSALQIAGVNSELVQQVMEENAEEAERAALRYARRRRIGPFAEAPPDRDQKRRWIAAMARAGHSLDLIFRILEADPADADIDL